MRGRTTYAIYSEDWFGLRLRATGGEAAERAGHFAIVVCLSVDDFASGLTNCLSVDEFASGLTNCLSVDEFAFLLSVGNSATTRRRHHTHKITDHMPYPPKQQ